MSTRKQFEQAAQWVAYYKRRGYNWKPNYTGCECHDACNEAWATAHNIVTEDDVDRGDSGERQRDEEDGHWRDSPRV